VLEPVSTYLKYTHRSGWSPGYVHAQVAAQIGLVFTFKVLVASVFMAMFSLFIGLDVRLLFVVVFSYQDLPVYFVGWVGSRHPFLLA
jgi:hypothetical protein